MSKYNIVDESGKIVKTITGYWNAKRCLNELKAQQQSKKVQVEYEILKDVSN